MNTRLNEQIYGNRANVSNVCLLLVNEKKTSKYLEKVGLNKFCKHTIVVSADDTIDLAAIRKKICPEAELVRGMYPTLILVLYINSCLVIFLMFFSPQFQTS